MAICHTAFFNAETEHKTATTSSLPSGHWINDGVIWTIATYLDLSEKVLLLQQTNRQAHTSMKLYFNNQFSILYHQIERERESFLASSRNQLGNKNFSDQLTKDDMLQLVGLDPLVKEGLSYQDANRRLLPGFLKRHEQRIKDIFNGKSNEATFPLLKIFLHFLPLFDNQLACHFLELALHSDDLRWSRSILYSARLLEQKEMKLEKSHLIRSIECNNLENFKEIISHSAGKILLEHLIHYYTSLFLSALLKTQVESFLFAALEQYPDLLWYRTIKKHPFILTIARNFPAEIAKTAILISSRSSTQSLESFISPCHNRNEICEEIFKLFDKEIFSLYLNNKADIRPFINYIVKNPDFLFALQTHPYFMYYVDTNLISAFLNQKRTPFSPSHTNKKNIFHFFLLLKKNDEQFYHRFFSAFKEKHEEILLEMIKAGILTREALPMFIAYLEKSIGTFENNIDIPTQIMRKLEAKINPGGWGSEFIPRQTKNREREKYAYYEKVYKALHNSIELKPTEISVQLANFGVIKNQPKHTSSTNTSLLKNAFKSASMLF